MLFCNSYKSYVYFYLCALCLKNERKKKTKPNQPPHPICNTSISKGISASSTTVVQPAAITTNQSQLNIVHGSPANGMATIEPSGRTTPPIHSKPPINSIVKNSPFIINNNNQKRKSLNGGGEAECFKKPTPKPSLITSIVKQYCDKNGDQPKRYHSGYISKKNLANRQNGTSNVDLMETVTATSTAKHTTNNGIATNGTNIVAPSYSYSSSALQDDDLLNIDVKSLVSIWILFRLLCNKIFSISKWIFSRESIGVIFCHLVDFQLN